MITAENIKVGAPVYDASGDRIGTVEDVQFGDEDPTSPGPETATATNPEVRDDTLIDNLADALVDVDRIPEEVRQRLIRHGFIRIDRSNIFTGDSVIGLDQVAHVSGDEVHLSVAADDLMTL